METAKKHSAFWRRTPPALFPSCLGGLGLALLWRNLAELGAPMWIGEALAFAASVLFLFTFACFAMKLLRRPSVIFDDLMIAPARGAVSGGSICFMLLAAVLAPYNVALAQVVWVFSLGLHVVYMICVIKILREIPDAQASVTPGILLPFVGFIVAGIAGVPLGFSAIVFVLAVITAPLYLIIVAVSLQNAMRTGVTPPNKTTFAIILAPMSVFALVGFSLGLFEAALFAGALLIAAILLAYAPWMARGGFNPGWGAFTFPVAAFGSVMIKGVLAGYGLIAWIPMIAAVVLASSMIPFVIVKTYRLWAKGVLAEATKAAVA